MSFIKIYFLYIIKHYIKNFLAILMGLTLSFSIINYFQNAFLLEKGFNNQILYIYYISQEALSTLYPLAIIFSAIITKINFIKNNTMVSMYSFGYSKKDIIFPFLILSLSVHLIFVYLHTTEFSYASENAKSLYKDNQNSYSKRDMFFKYNNSFVYIKSLNPIKKEAYDIKIFTLNDSQLISTISASKAIFNGKVWKAEKINIKKQVYKDGHLQRVIIENKKYLDTLKDYKPKIIDQIYEGKSLNIVDAYDGLRLLNAQNLDSYKMRSAIYTKLFYPIFSICLVIIMFIKMPSYARFMNISLVVSALLGVTFLVWGVLFSLNQIGFSGTIIPELTSILPIILLIVYSFTLYLKSDNKI